MPPRRLRTAVVAMLVLAGVAVSPLGPADADAPSRLLSDVDIVLPPGGTGVVPNTVPTPQIPPNLDVFLLADATSSMGAPIAAVRRDAASIVSTVRGAQPSARFGVAEYRDTSSDPVPFRVNQPLTADTSKVVRGVSQWVATGGGDVPEDAYNALYRLSTRDGPFRDTRSRTIVWIGDAPSHNPSNGHTGAATALALRTAAIRVIAIDVGKLNATGQASALAARTGGSLLGNVPLSAISQAVLSGIREVLVTVTPRVLRCDPGLRVEFEPQRQTVRGGETARFQQRMTVAAGAEPGDYQCVVRYAFNDKPAEQTDTITARVRGISIDDVTVIEGTRHWRWNWPWHLLWHLLWHHHHHHHQHQAVFTVSLSGPSPQPVSVAFTTVSGSASIPEDLAWCRGRITFPPGVTERTVRVWIRPDPLDEPREMFSVNLSRAWGAGIADSVGIGTIVDDD